MSGLDQRRYWVETLVKIIDPVLTALAKKQFKKTMPVEQVTGDRDSVTYLEALARTLVGSATWLELDLKEGAENQLRLKYADLARKAIDAATDPMSPDFMNFSEGGQPIVDAAFLSHAILRAPTELWEKLEQPVKINLINALKETRKNRKPVFSNWLLFSAMIEAALYRMGEDFDHMRVDYAIRQFEQWYCGDGVYSDGPEFRFDYYNSFVIEPMLLDILLQLGDFYKEWDALKQPVLERTQRYAEVLERFISPEGTYPPIGRSITYRFGAFQTLAQVALMHKLPKSILPAQVRCALTAVIEKTMKFNNFDENGWLKIGICGSQPGLGEIYISTGSLYLCTAGLLPLGLPPEDEFWSGKDELFTSQKIWAGENVGLDHSI